MTIKEFAMISLAFFLLLSCFYLQFVTATDTITPSKSIKSPGSIISNGSKFQLGFFNLTDSTDLFVGIWYYGMDPANGVVWVANRQKPLKDSPGIVMISEDGNLVVLNGQKEVLWSSSVQNLEAKNTSAQLQDSGNLVLVDKTTGMNVWESFRQPTNVGMPTMEVGLNVRTGQKVQLTSWKSPSDPSIGNFSAGINPSSIPQFFVWNNSKPYWRSGPWNGRIFIGVPDMHSFPLDGFNLVADKEEGSLYLTFAFADESNLLDFLLDSEGKLVERIWHRREKRWEIKRSIPETECDVYGKCGPFGSCDYSKNPNICSCLKGFKPTNAKEWDRGNWTSGCVRKTTLQCHRTNNISEPGNKVGFLKLENMKVPDFVERSTIQEDECKDSCQKSCSCVAYAYDANIGCMTWNGTLIDIRKFSSGGIDLYIRVPYSELDRKLGMIMTISGIVGITIISICAMLVWKLIAKHRACKKRIKDMKLFDRRKTSSKFSSDMLGDNIKELQELPLFSYDEVANATRNFDPANQLGKGGFGPVYRGSFQNGQEIAVKRLSRASGQGLEEFMNEVLVISNVQHQNLVRLLGCCVEHEEKILVYEYLPNKSLDSFLFHPLKNEFLDWGRRFSIIEGISRGLLYLHRDSRLRIIHRDLKASNILLDERLNPKISDFGMARIFGGDEDHANTRRIAGTYGYMSPEYAMEGLFSEKSDVFSYGVLLLEIVSGRRNTSFYNDKHSLSLVGYAWKLWNEGNISALIDEAISDPCHHREALRCIHVGLMCVQEFAEDRPTMSKVISMLNSEIVDLPPPKQPAFCQKQILLNSQSSSQDEYKYYSVNDVTDSSVQGR